MNIRGKGANKPKVIQKKKKKQTYNLAQNLFWTKTEFSSVQWLEQAEMSKRPCYGSIFGLIRNMSYFVLIHIRVW